MLSLQHHRLRCKYVVGSAFRVQGLKDPEQGDQSFSNLNLEPVNQLIWIAEQTGWNL